jgi:hypothetical protein
VHWLNSTWGVASFVDAGDAADSWKDFSLHKSLGRWPLSHAGGADCA